MTTPYSDLDLEAMMADIESELVERKESLKKAPPGKDGPIERIRQAVCAFANHLPGHGQPGAADYRNPSLAESMRVLGLVQRFGVGIDITRAALRRNAQPEPIFDVQPNWVRCVVKARPGSAGVP